MEIKIPFSTAFKESENPNCSFNEMLDTPT